MHVMFMCFTAFIEYCEVKVGNVICTAFIEYYEVEVGNFICTSGGEGDLLIRCCVMSSIRVRLLPDVCR